METTARTRLLPRPKWMLTLLLAMPFTGALAQDDRTVGAITRSDSIDLLHTRIDLDMTQVTSGIISAQASIRFVPRIQGITTLPLDLLQLTVDSVLRNDAPLAFVHAGEELSVDLGGSFGPGDTMTVDIHYHGDPVVDASGWGGFYTLSSYQYDLGVAFDAVPHSYGRSWFPCFDNFVERCTFEYNVRTANDRTVFANGALSGVTDLGSGQHEWHWSMAEPIPSYLASVASTNYVAVLDTFPSINGTQVPVTLVARPPDTTQMKASFIHLRNAFDTFERWFGPYRWERVGYVLTSQGAMEHPTNICYPDGIADGTLQYEETMAHELGHHWFGDLITCRTAEEMYINEGAAVYLSQLFVEDLYGRDAYSTKVRNMHHDMVTKAHLMDGGWFALAAVPQSVTYGEHTYRKGAGIFHTLRSYLGDTLFGQGFRRVLSNNAFSDMSTHELRDSLIAATGRDLAPFFSDWIEQPGWAAFEVDSMSSAESGGVWPTTLHIEQKLRHADHLYTQVPATLTFESATGQRWNDPQPAILDGAQTVVTSSPPFQPLFAFVNADERLALGTTVAIDTLTSNGFVNMALADMAIFVQDMPSPAPVRAEEFWTAADDVTSEPFAFVVSPDRWWRVTGQLPEGANIDMRFTVDGRPASSTMYDPGLVQAAGGVSFMEDSLVVLYRPNARFPWSEYANTTVNFQGASHTDGYARLTAAGASLGDYAIGWRKSATGLAPTGDPHSGWRVFPNPSDGLVTVEAPASAMSTRTIVRVQDMQGRILKEQPLTALWARLDLRGLAAGPVFLSATVPGHGTFALGRLVLSR